MHKLIVVLVALFVLLLAWPAQAQVHHVRKQLQEDELVEVQARNDLVRLWIPRGMVIKVTLREDGLEYQLTELFRPKLFSDSKHGLLCGEDLEACGPDADVRPPWYLHLAEPGQTFYIWGKGRLIWQLPAYEDTEVLGWDPDSPGWRMFSVPDAGSALLFQQR